LIVTLPDRLCYTVTVLRYPPHAGAFRGSYPRGDAWTRKPRRISWWR